ncbi:MAG: caspase family protein [Tildeniella nuda ZEHNDER 1965/U140]|jgi:hypothetical protein|nr:caspase family protein [Tildeniella nuda ZEHNDER 1965/U140]
MPPIKRRHFLQGAGSTLAAIGFSQMNLWQQANQYGRVLAQGKPGRKLALLVGANNYAPLTNLHGCLTDVRLQYELLVHRYGFNPKDILVVADRKLPFTDYEPLKPTRQNILTAFETHLIQQAKPDDVVVFHYSGHGSLVRDPNPLPQLIKNEDGVKQTVPNTDRVNGTIVPIDRQTSRPDEVQDIMGRSLFLLMRALNTENITVVLDSCHSGGGSRGNLVFRNVPSRLDLGTPANPSPVELEYQQQWMSKLKLTEANLTTLRQKGIAKGVAIGSAQYDQLAADSPFDGFHAGAFTYLLTRYLWQQATDEPIRDVFVSLSRSTRDVSRSGGLTQEPIFAANPDSNGQKPVYFSPPPRPFAEAVVQTVDASGQIQFWLGGISSRSLEANKEGSIFSVIDDRGKEIAEIEQVNRYDGLTAVGKLRKGSLQGIRPGTLLRERVRGLPSDLKLKVGLDPSLGTDLAAAKAALQTIDRVEVAASNQNMNYRVGRMTAAYRGQLSRSTGTPPEVGSLGLFTANLHPLTPTFKQPNESIADAIERLAPRLKSFLAAEVLKAIGGVDNLVTSQSATNQQTGAIQVELRPDAPTQTNLGRNRFQAGTQIRVNVTNTSDRDRFVAVISIGDSGNLRVLLPYLDAPEDRARIAPRQTLTVPEKGVTLTLGAPGSLEVMVLSSGGSIVEALKALKAIGARGGVSSSRELSRAPMDGSDTLDVVGSLLGNIDRNTRSDIVVSASVQAVDVKKYAVVSTVIEVV